MNGNFNLLKYSNENGGITLKKEVAELNNWYEFEEILHKAYEAIDKNYQNFEKWKNLTGVSRTFGCYISEVENTIKQLGGKVKAERERERENKNQTFGLSMWV